MNYQFRVNIANDNYPLYVFYKVKTFSEYGLEVINPENLIPDGNGGFYANVKFSITNWENSSNSYEKNNLSCVSSSLTVKTYAFQRGEGDAYNWLDIPQYQTNPESYAGFSEFLDDNHTTTKTMIASAVPASQFTSVSLANYVVRTINRVAVEITGEGDTTTQRIIIEQNSNSIFDQSITLHKTSYGNWYVSDELNFTIPNTYLEQTGLRCYVYGTVDYSYHFTTKSIKSNWNHEGYNSDGIQNEVEVYFNGMTWDGSTEVYSVFGGSVGDNGNLVSSTETITDDSVCSATNYHLLSVTYTDDTPSKIFNTNPVLFFHDGSTIKVTQIDSTQTFNNFCDKVGVMSSDMCSITNTQQS